MVPDVNRFLPKPASKLRDRSNRDMIQSPEGVFVESPWSLFQAYFNEIGQKVVLALKVFFLDALIEFRVFAF